MSSRVLLLDAGRVPMTQCNCDDGWVMQSLCSMSNYRMQMTGEIRRRKSWCFRASRVIGEHVVSSLTIALFAITACFLFLELTWASPMAVPSMIEKRIALVIGNYDYDVAPLRNPGNDADDIAMALSVLGFQVDKRKNATRSEMVEAVRLFGQALRESNGIGLFYYSGHGVQVQGENYLIPVSADMRSERDVEPESVALARVLGELTYAGNPSNIVILDACRNNPFAQGYRTSARGLALVKAPSGTFVAFSTAPGDVADDGGERNGVYTKHLLVQIGQPALQVEEVFKRVRGGVIQETAGRQVPWEMSSLTASVVFKGMSTIVMPMGRSGGTARLEIETLPAHAMLFMDDRAVGSAPVTLTDLPKGWPLIRAQFTDGRIREQRVVLADGEHVRTTLMPDSAGTRLDIASSPSEATIFIDEFPAGNTPRQLSGLMPGTHRLRISRAGYDDWVRDINAQPEVEVLPINIRLDRSVGAEYEDRLADGSRGPAMVVIKSGCARLGSDSSELGRDEDEVEHEECLSRKFAMGKFELTVGEFQRFIDASGYTTDAELDRVRGCFAWSFDDNKWAWRAGMTWRDPGFAPTADMPLVCASWNDVTAFALWLSAQTGQSYRLPTETEWEYAARAGNSESRFWGSNAHEACRFANVLDTTRGPRGRSASDEHACRDGFVSIAPVGRFRENGFGLRDMLGNVWEWTCSAYQVRRLQGGDACVLAAPAPDTPRVLRGGSWNYGPSRVRSANRNFAKPDTRFFDVGFRVVSEL